MDSKKVETLCPQENPHTHTHTFKDYSTISLDGAGQLLKSSVE